MVKSFSDKQVGMRWSVRHAVLACSILCVGGGLCFESSSAQGVDGQLIQKEIRKRAEERILAEQLLVAGDREYNEKKYKEAVVSYSKAFSLLPKAGLTGEMRFVAADRYAQASVERAKYLAKNGDYAGAKRMLDAVLAEDVAPGHAGAMIMREKVDDPIRYNQALTPEHVQNIEKVAHWLRRGEGYYDLGQNDKALLAYEEVIRIDPYNTAARRGMERVTQAMSQHQNAAYDQTRAKFMQEVDAGWETKPENMEVVTGVGESPRVDGATLIQDVASRKLDQILIPMVDFSDITLEEAVDTMRQWAREFDTTELDNSRKGVNFVLRMGDATSRTQIMNKRLNIQLRNVPLSKVLDFVTKASNTQWRSDTFGVVLTPAGMLDSVIRNRTFKVPPGFMQDSVSGEAETNNDPFATESGRNSVLKPRLSTVEYLKRIGVTFPEGSTASYIAGANTLSVANTETNLSFIEEYLRTLRQKESVQVIVKLTVIDIAQDDLEELGYDWLIGANNLSSNNLFLGGGTQGSGSLIPGTVTGTAPVTSGLRSGGSTFAPDSIDARIAGQDLSTASATVATPRAPGILSVTGQLNGAGLQTVLRGLSQKKGSSRMFTPSVITRPGEKSLVYSGRKFTYPTEYEPAEVPNSATASAAATPSTPTAFESRDLGFKFEIEPTVSEDRNYIELRLNPEYTQFDGFINYGSPIQTVGVDPITGSPITTVITDNRILMPVFSVIRLNTSVTLRDGTTMVVGGLHQAKIDEVNDSVPILGDLPFIGRFFQSKGYRPSKRALVIFVNAKLVDPTGRDWKDR